MARIQRLCRPHTELPVAMVLALAGIPRADRDEIAQAGGILPLVLAMFCQTVPRSTMTRQEPV